MEIGNTTQVKEFILLGFNYNSQTKILLFVSLLIVYLVDLSANSLFILVTAVDSRLHSPMYFFLCNLSFLDLCYSSVSVPTAMKGFLIHRVTITISQCLTQMYIGLAMGQTECFLLAVMAWDRYVAICNPLNYQQIMTHTICMKLAIATWTTGFLVSLTSVVVLPMLHFCGHIIDHTVCEFGALSQLTCVRNHSLDYTTSIMSLFTLVAPVALILCTYIHIIATILRMPKAESRHRTFATCGSHLIVVVLFFGTAMVIYLGPKTAVSSEKDKSISVFYGLVVPALNPLIYTLRNKDVKVAMKKMYIRNCSLQRSRA